MDCDNNDVIKAINQDTVHKICSGQVIISVSTAIKELIENSIDANATFIDILLREYGSDSIEITDNGKGIHENNFEFLALKHCTSKIKRFSDLENVTTLGFRGEALNSLCALSNLTIITKHETADIGTKLCFNNNGKIISKTSQARENGTTVIVKELFSTLPVRRKEFLKNLKREFYKMCQFLYAYSLVSKGIKFSCFNTNNSVKKKIITTEGLTSIIDNITNLFGIDQVSNIIKVDYFKPDTSIMEDFQIQIDTDDYDIPFRFEFYITNALHDTGRSSNDRQFIYINSRPFNSNKITKLIVDIYKQLNNNNKYPFIFLNIFPKNCLIDVNVTPDKREIFIEKENYLLAALSSSLKNTFKYIPSTFEIQNCNVTQNNFNDDKKTAINLNDSVKRAADDDSEIKNITNKGTKKTNKRFKIDEFIKKEINKQRNLSLDDVNVIDSNNIINKDDENLNEENPTNYSNDFNESIISSTPIEVLNIDKTKYDTIINDESTNLKNRRKSTIINVSLEEILKKFEKKIQLNRKEKIENTIKFKTKISPENNKNAEEELQRQIKLDDFKNMRIIGQFNVGFIITQLNNDLFIVDQHASDEKYNYEQLQKTTIINKQILVSPRSLELSAPNEVLLINNLEVFKKNGFQFKINENATSTNRIQLTAVPLLKNIVFNKEDIEEMLIKLQESNEKFYFPTRIKHILASKACRKSIMIGKSLSKINMRKLIDQMSETKEPWNCPHGRPTMRHLINFDLM